MTGACTQHRRQTRRTPLSMTPPPEQVSPHPSMPSSFTKSATFHAPLTPPSECSSPLIVATPALPRRAQTCSKALEEVVASREQRMAALLSSLDSRLPGAAASASSKHQTKNSYRGEDLPLPRGVLSSASDADPTDKKTSRRQQQQQLMRHHHTSDSGLGSSVSESLTTPSRRGVVLASFTAINTPRTRSGKRSDSMASQSSSSSRGLSAITRSHSALTPSSGDSHTSLSVHANAQIQKLIINPILRRHFLRDFHPLLRDVPRRIHTKEILCLRDLEKTLLLLAPERAKSPELYLNFCETSIHCIQATVDTLSDLDQRRPSDRPYTNGYFLDLVAQVRHYAGIMASSREKESSGAALEENDYTPNEQVALHGGISQTGRPAELVRVKNGKKISIATGDEVSDTESSARALKRASSQGLSDDDSVHRSMARRAGKRKLTTEAAKAMAHQQCSECGKEFKRPCDLTKHEKTHSRPWKCTKKDCKYFTLGWPTEKERDRHVNDRHSDAPALYYCEYPPCVYKSKRESNCKQHMEKTHGWTYVRSKNNGKAAPKPSTSTRTPQTPNLGTPGSSSIGTPRSNFDVTGSSRPYNTHANQPNVEYDDGEDLSMDPLADFPLDTGFSFGDYDNMDTMPIGDINYASDGINYRRESLASSNPSSHGAHSDFQPSPHIPGTSASYEHHHQWSAEPRYPNDMTSFQVHMPTPEQLMTPMDSVKEITYHSFDSRNSALSHANASPAAYFSPGTQGHVMLYTPPADGENVDEGFEEFIPPTGRHQTDFNLFSSEASSVSNPTDGMFQDLTSFDANPSQSLSQAFPEYMDWVDEHN